MNKYVYDYYKVIVPGDAADSIETLADLAISTAQENVKLHCLPAVWSAKHISGEVGDQEVVFKVCRKREKP